MDISEGSAAFQIALLGLIFVALGVVSDGLWAVAAGSAAGWLRGNTRFLRAHRHVSGTTLVGLGVATALSGSRKG